MAQFSAGLSEVIAPAPWPTPEFLPGATSYASETWDNGISLHGHAEFDAIAAAFVPLIFIPPAILNIAITSYILENHHVARGWHISLVIPGFNDPDSPNLNCAVPGLTRDLPFAGKSRRSRVKPGTAWSQRIGSDQ